MCAECAMLHKRMRLLDQSQIRNRVLFSEVIATASLHSGKFVKPPRLTHTLFSAAALLLPIAAKADWRYLDAQDRMTKAIAPLAYVGSDNRINLPAPYSGGTTAEITVKQVPGRGVYAYFTVSKGQMICHPQNNGCDVVVRFDESKPVTFAGDASADYDSTIIYLKDAARFIRGARKARTILVQAMFYQAGLQVFEFSTAPLVWPPKKNGCNLCS